MSKRDYIEEILAKQGRLHKRSSRIDIFRKRVHPLVHGFRAIKSLDKSISWRNEWLKYSSIGYIACVEGYFRLLLRDIIDNGDPFLSRVGEFKEIHFTAATVVAIQTKKISLGEFTAHLLPINGISDINSHLSILLGIDYIKFYKEQQVSIYNPKPIGEVFPEHLGNVERLFMLRHLYAHELATKVKFPVREIEELVGSAAILVTHTEEIINREWLKIPNTTLKRKTDPGAVPA